MAFNRFYTRKLGVLDQQLLNSPFSLSEARALYELAHREDDSAAKEIGIELGLDAYYLSRIVQKLDDDGLITRNAAAAATAGTPRLDLTAKGRQAFAKLNRSLARRGRGDAGRNAIDGDQPRGRRVRDGRIERSLEPKLVRRPLLLPAMLRGLPRRATWAGWS